MKKQPPKPKKQMFEPQKGKLLILRKEEEKVSEGGIFILDNAKEKPQQGEVVAVGPGGRDEAGKLIPIDIKSGVTSTVMTSMPSAGTSLDMSLLYLTAASIALEPKGSVSKPSNAHHGSTPAAAPAIIAIYAPIKKTL